jgi:hypothetical protein
MTSGNPELGSQRTKIFLARPDFRPVKNYKGVQFLLNKYKVSTIQVIFLCIIHSLERYKK